MQYEEFVLRQLKRNEKIYSVCMKVFLVFMIVFVLALIGILIGGLGIEMTIFDVILMLIIAVEYPTFKKLKDQANFASAEIEAALVTTGFRIPEDYTDRTKKIRSKIEQEPKKLMISAVSIGILALTCFGGMGMILWACSFSGFEDFNAWYATSVGVFGMIGIILVVLMILYLKHSGGLDVAGGIADAGRMRHETESEDRFGLRSL